MSRTSKEKTVFCDKTGFVRVSYHALWLDVLTPQGLIPNTKQVAAVESFPIPQNVIDLCWSLGLASHYQNFIAEFKAVRWEWTEGTSLLFSCSDFDVDFVI